MNKLWSALAVTIIIFLLAFTEFFVTKNTADNILEIIDKTEISAKNSSEDTEKFCGEIKNLWENNKSKLQIFLPHGDIDNIDISIERIKRYCEEDRFDKAYIECGVLKNRVNSLKDGEEISLVNRCQVRHKLVSVVNPA